MTPGKIWKEKETTLSVLEYKDGKAILAQITKDEPTKYIIATIIEDIGFHLHYKTDKICNTIAEAIVEWVKLYPSLGEKIITDLMIIEIGNTNDDSLVKEKLLNILKAYTKAKKNIIVD